MGDVPVEVPPTVQEPVSAAEADVGAGVPVTSNGHAAGDASMEIDSNTDVHALAPATTEPVPPPLNGPPKLEIPNGTAAPVAAAAEAAPIAAPAEAAAAPATTVDGAAPAAAATPSTAPASADALPSPAAAAAPASGSLAGSKRAAEDAGLSPPPKRGPRQGSYQGGTVVIRLLVNNRLVPLVIGKGGSTVNDFQSRTQSRIVVSIHSQP